MASNTVYLTFKTDRVTSDMLKEIARSFEMSQPELIDKICKEYIKDLLTELNEIAKEKLDELGINPDGC